MSAYQSVRIACLQFNAKQGGGPNGYTAGVEGGMLHWREAVADNDSIYRQATTGRLVRLGRQVGNLFLLLILCAYLPIQPIILNFRGQASASII